MTLDSEINLSKIGLTVPPKSMSCSTVIDIENSMFIAVEQQPTIQINESYHEKTLRASVGRINWEL